MLQPLCVAYDDRPFAAALLYTVSLRLCNACEGMLGYCLVAATFAVSAASLHVARTSHTRLIAISIYSLDQSA